MHYTVHLTSSIVQLKLVLLKINFVAIAAYTVIADWYDSIVFGLNKCVLILYDLVCPLNTLLALSIDTGI